jgi:nitrate/TMAO reductase-like tetraheme cytochrome c subunit
VLSATGAPDFQHDAVEFWAARILVWALVMGVVLTIVALVRASRGQLVGPAGRALMLIAVVVVPAFCVSTGMLLVFTRAERVEFCASCHHVMEPYAADMTNPRGTGLAAVHFANRYIPGNQCYECHTSYGLFGTVKAKVHGMAEVVKYYGGLYDQPVAMWQPYPNGDCLKCHAESRKWLAVSAHSGGEVSRQLFSDELSCMECHVSAHQVGQQMTAAAS